MSAIGPATQRDRFNAFTLNANLAVGAADQTALSVFNGGKFRRVCIGTAGVVYLQGMDDAAAVRFDVVAGQVIEGEFQLLGGTTNYASSSSGLKLTVSF